MDDPSRTRRDACLRQPYFRNLLGGPVAPASVMPRKHWGKQQPGHSSTKCGRAESWAFDHAAQRTEAKISERSRFQKGESSTRAHDCDSGLEHSVPE